MKNIIKTAFVFWVYLLAHQTDAQNTVSGVIKDTEGNPLVGATIQIEGTTSGTTSDIEGEFLLPINGKSTVLVINYIGFITQRIQANAGLVLEVLMEEDIEALEEVVVVGYGTVRKSDLTGSVGSIDTKEVKKLATVDINRAIQGKVAGVQVTTNSGAPGSGTAIRVRGIGSFGNSNPLYVVDGFLTGDISNISPNDIETMEVLKDASATAIYGSRGANGVIIISTKKGLKKGIEVDLNTYTGFQSAWNTIEMLDAPTYALAYLESRGGRISDIDPSLRYWVQNSGTGTDWQNEVLQDAPISMVDVSIRGGYKKLRYKVGGSFFSQDGIVINTYGKRYQGSVDLDYQVTDRVSIAAGVKYSVNQWTPYDNGLYSSVLGTALRKDPITTATDPVSGDWFRTNLTDLPNPARRAYEQQFRFQESVRIQPSISVSYEIIDGLTFNSNANWDDRVIDGYFLNPSNVTVERDEDGSIVRNPNESTNNIFYNRTQNELEVFQLTNTLNYTKKFGKHSINALVGLESFERTNINRSFAITPDTLYSVRYRDLDTFDPNLLDDFHEDVREIADREDLNPDRERAFNLLSYFARAVYSYDDRYLLTATVRRDGSSKFSPGERWGTFPSFSAGWNVDQEGFFPKNKVLSGVKLRAGWGQVGNSEPIAPYQFLSILAGGWAYPFDNESGTDGFAARFLPATTIRWETSETSNFAADLFLLDDRLTLTAEYYVKTTRDLLVNSNFVPSPVFAGANAPTTNAASMQNDGVELTLDFSQQVKDLSFSVGGNISFIDNEVTSLGAGERLEGAGYEPKIILPITRTEVGGEFASFYGLQTLGIFQTQEEIDAHGSQPRASPGDVKYLDADDDGAITSEDAVFLGSPIPDITYGFYLNASYKSIDLSAAFTGPHGNEIANIFTYYNAGASATINNLTQERWDNRLTGPGSTNTDPRVTDQPTTNDIFSDRYIEDGSFMRLRNVQIGYTLPSKLVSKLKIKSARIYVSADNLLTITNYSGFDPEVGLAFNGDPFGNGVDLGNYPQARTIIIGTNIKF